MANTYGIDEGIDGFGMFEELLKISECQMAVIIGKRIHDNQKQRYDHKDRRENNVRKSPALT